MKPHNVNKPTPKQIAAWRKRHGLTAQQAADLTYSSRRTWHNWESGAHPMSRAIWELLLIRSGELPA